jgi:hypothetical protein
VGGRERLVDVLALAKLDGKQELLLRLLTDPARRADSLAHLCADAGVKANELLAIFREAAFAKAFTLAQHTLAERLPAVVEDVADKATNHTEPCHCVVINGVPDKKCPGCNGSGKRFFRSSVEHQELLLEAAGLLKKGGGVNVAVQTVVGDTKGFFDGFVRSTDEAAYAVDAIDAEVIRSEQEAG